jgi:nucleoside-diphosphate-sugar epimerase
MKVFVAGATGVLGRAAVRAFVNEGHEVIGVARTPEKGRLLADLGAQSVTCDLFDIAAVRSAVVGSEVVCNFATKIPKGSRYFLKRAWRGNDRLHREASANLVDAALETGSSRYLQHSVAFQYADGGSEWITEDDAIDPPAHGLAIVDAEHQTRRFTDGGGVGVVLRFGVFYGPDAPNTRDLLRIARLGFVPFPGGPDAFLSSIHTDDLGRSVIAALAAAPGEYNVVDDEPITRLDLGKAIARALGRKRLRIQPALSTRLGTSMALIARSLRVSNERFKYEAGWTPTVTNAQDGWTRTVNALRPSDEQV